MIKTLKAQVMGHRGPSVTQGNSCKITSYRCYHVIYIKIRGIARIAP
jgi:hypothetical protein